MKSMSAPNEMMDDDGRGHARDRPIDGHDKAGSEQPAFRERQPGQAAARCGSGTGRPISSAASIQQAIAS